MLALVIALAVGRAAGTEVTEEDTPEADPLPAGVAREVLLAYGVSGFVALALEVLWTRLLVIAFLGTTYAYTTMLTVLLAGLVIGGGIGSVLVRLRRVAPAWLGVSLVVCALANVLMLRSIAGIPEALRDYSNDWDVVVQATFTLSAWALLPSAILFGLTFPFAVALLGRARATLGRDLGAMYAVNTLAGMLGAIAGGYVIIPALGTHAGVIVLAMLLFLAGARLINRCQQTSPAKKGALAVLATVALVVGYALEPRDVMESLNAGYIPESDRLIHFSEHTEGTVAVSEPKDGANGSDRTLWINRVQATASIEKGVKMNRFQGVLPLLFDRMPQDVLFMCFGSGVTCGTLALSDFRSIDAVEINPGVLEVAKYFATDNLDVLANPMVHPHIDDGRNFLLTTQKKFDLITFEPMPLALAGVSTFYTEEYYRLCLARLNPGGLVSQWVPLHSLDPETVQGLARTFLDVMPHCTGWFVNSDLFLIGSNEELRLDFAAGRERLARPRLQEAIAAVGFKDAEEVYASFLMTDASLRDWAHNGERLNDDLPWAEFNAPKLIYSGKVPDAVATLEPHVISPAGLFREGTITEAELAAVERRHLAHRNDFTALKGYYKNFAIDPTAAREFMRSLAIDPNDYNAQGYVKLLLEKQGSAFLKWEEFDKLEAILAEVVVYLPDDLDVQLLLGDLYHAKGDAARAKAEYKRYVELGGTEPRAVAAAAAP